MADSSLLAYSRQRSSHDGGLHAAPPGAPRRGGRSAFSRARKTPAVDESSASGYSLQTAGHRRPAKTDEASAADCRCAACPLAGRRVRRALEGQPCSCGTARILARRSVLFRVVHVPAHRRWCGGARQSRRSDAGEPQCIRRRRVQRGRPFLPRYTVVGPPNAAGAHASPHHRPARWQRRSGAPGGLPRADAASGSPHGRCRRREHRQGRARHLHRLRDG